MRLDDLREEYGVRRLSRDGLGDDPVAQFVRWLDEAIAAGLREPHAMTLATATADGRPSARIVLLKEVDARGFVFATNYESRKAAELEANPRACLVFVWLALERQVRVAGTVARCPGPESDAIFAARPREARLSAWASPQSRPLASRLELERRFADVAVDHPGDVPRPAHWGGYRLAPESLEFWQGRPGRLHDRFLYTRPDGAAWRLTRLAP